MSIIAATLFWLSDTTIHYYILKDDQFELIPSDPNEFIMRSIIIILFICFGYFADRQTKAMIELEIKKERQIVFNATICSTQHIVNNLLNQMQYFKTKPDGENIFDEEHNHLYDKCIKEGKELVEKLSAVTELTEENIKSSVSPRDC